MDRSNRFSPLVDGKAMIHELPSGDFKNSHDPDIPHKPQEPRKLSGRAAEFVDSLPNTIYKQVCRLLDAQTEKQRLEEAYQKELMALQNKYLTKYQPLYSERKTVVTGADLEDDLESIMDGFAGPPAGIPEFWLVAMQKHDVVSYLIQPWDEEPLSYLTDIRIELLKAPELGFRLVFDFAANPYFTDKWLTKTYTYEKEEDGVGLFYGEAVGHSICWKPGKELPPPQHEVSDDPGNESLPDSFFDFFSPPSLLDVDEDLDIFEMKLTLDYGYGEAFKEKLIPDAVDWFVGRAGSPNEGPGNDGLSNESFGDNN